MGKKYIIELEDNESVYKTVVANGYPMIQIIVPAPYTEPDMEQVRKEAYQKGLEDAWEAARKICLTESEGGFSSKTVCYIFNTEYYRDALKDYTPAKAIEKIRLYEQEKEEQDGLRQNIQTIVDQCGYSLDEIASVLQKMKES